MEEASSLKAYADGLAIIYGQEKVPFVYAHPAAKLVSGITTPQIGNSVNVECAEWPKSIGSIVTQRSRCSKH